MAMSIQSDERKTLHFPQHIHEKLLFIKSKLGIPITRIVDRMADATIEAMRRDK